MTTRSRFLWIFHENSYRFGELSRVLLIFCRYTGSAKVAMVLCHLIRRFHIHCCDYGPPTREGWFDYPSEEHNDQLNMTHTQIRSGIKQLMHQKLIFIQRMGMPSRRFIRFNEKEILRIINGAPNED